MINTDVIAEHMEVMSADDKHVGTVDHMEEDRIKLTASDPAGAGMHHFIPVDWVSDVGDKVRLHRTQEEVFSEWDEE